MSSLPQVHQNWGGPGSSRPAPHKSAPTSSSSVVALPDIRSRGVDPSSPSGAPSSPASSPTQHLQQPPTPRKVDTSQMASFEIMELLQARGIAPTGFFEDDKQRLQNMLNEEYLEAVAAREKYNAAIAASHGERLRQAGELRRKHRQGSEEEAFLKKHPHILQWVKNMQAGTCGKYFSLAKTKAAGVRFVLKNLVPSCPLRIFELRHCHLDDALAKVLAVHLRANRSLESLDVSENSMNGEGVRALVEALEVNDVLKALNLAHNDLSGRGGGGAGESEKTARAIARMLQANQGLMHVNLIGTRLSPADLHIVAEGMNLNHNIIVFDVDHRSMKVQDARTVADAIQRNRALKKRREIALREQKIAERKAQKQSAEVEEQRNAAKEAKRWVAQQKRARMMERRKQLEKQRQAERAAEDAILQEKERIVRESLEAELGAGGKKKKKKAGGAKKKKKK